MHLVGENGGFCRVPAVVYRVSDAVVVIAYTAVDGEGKPVERVHDLAVGLSEFFRIGVIVVADVAAVHDEGYPGAAVDYVSHGVNRVGRELIGGTVLYSCHVVHPVVLVGDEDEVQRRGEEFIFAIFSL